MQRQQIPGISVAILRGDRILLARGYGFANLEHRVPASDSTVYQSGSLGKQFTATAVGMLAQQGRLKIEDRSPGGFRKAKGRGTALPCAICSPIPPASRITPTR